MCPFDIEDSPPPTPSEAPMASLSTQFQVAPGVDDYSVMLYVLHADGSIVEYGRNNTAQWVPVNVVKQND